VESTEQEAQQGEWAKTIESVLPPMRVGPGMISNAVDE
jgi:hypothetical protein